MFDIVGEYEFQKYHTIFDEQLLTSCAFMVILRSAEGNIMKQFLVGGAVRDMQMGRDVNDFDYVVVGSTAEEMLEKGYSQVGAAFPVFLHPATGAEYALARTERSTGDGYHDFTVDFSPEVTLEEDLMRRDLTVNAMALDKDGEVVDPFHGLTDMKNKVLRHVSPAFAEDPVRVLRLARFHAQFGSDWKVAAETVEMVRQMVRDGMLEALTGERVFQELRKALRTASPRVFFDTLDHVGALESVFPVLHKMRTVKESMKWHPEGNTYEHTMLVVEAAAKMLDVNERQVFNALVHDFGKTLTDPAEYPRHYMHEVTGVRLVKEFADQMRVPATWKKNAALVTRYHMHMHKLDIMNPKTFVKMFDGMGAWNNPEVVADLQELGVADMRGKLGNEDAPRKDREFLSVAFAAAAKVKFMDVLPEGKDPNQMSGEAKAQLMFRERTKAVAQARQQWKVLHG